MSNNTIYCDSYDHIAEGIWDGYGGNGEPYGFFNLNLKLKIRKDRRKKQGKLRRHQPVWRNFPCG